MCKEHQVGGGVQALLRQPGRESQGKGDGGPDHAGMFRISGGF